VTLTKLGAILTVTDSLSGQALAGVDVYAVSGILDINRNEKIGSTDSEGYLGIAFEQLNSDITVYLERKEDYPKKTLIFSVNSNNQEINILLAPVVGQFHLTFQWMDDNSPLANYKVELTKPMALVLNTDETGKISYQDYSIQPDSKIEGAIVLRYGRYPIDIDMSGKYSVSETFKIKRVAHVTLTVIKDDEQTIQKVEISKANVVLFSSNSDRLECDIEFVSTGSIYNVMVTFTEEGAAFTKNERININGFNINRTISISDIFRKIERNIEKEDYDAAEQLFYQVPKNHYKIKDAAILMSDVILNKLDSNDKWHDFGVYITGRDFPHVREIHELSLFWLKYMETLFDRSEYDEAYTAASEAERWISSLAFDMRISTRMDVLYWKAFLRHEKFMNETRPDEDVSKEEKIAEIQRAINDWRVALDYSNRHNLGEKYPNISRLMDQAEYEKRLIR